MAQGTLAALPNHVDMVANITALYDGATPEQMRQGLTWYDDAREYAAALAAGTDYTIEQCAGVIAALSPQAPWAVNKLWAARIIEWHHNGAEGDAPKASTGANRAKAVRILDGEPVLDILGGVKVRAFFLNIMGAASVVTVDLWAYYCATGRKLANNEYVSKAANGPIQRAFFDAAAARLVSPAAMQAVVWVVARGRHD